MNPQQKRYFLYAAVVVVAILIGVLARFAFNDPLQDAVATAPLGDGSPGTQAPPDAQTAEPEKSASDRAAEAATAAAGAALKDAAPAAGGPDADSAASVTPAPAGPSFDIVRVEPTGEAIIAGRASPGSEVELLAGGQVISSAKANEAGEFVIMPERLPAGGHELTLREAGASTISVKAVVVSVPSSPGGEVLVVAGEPGKPSSVLQAGAAPPAPAPAAPATEMAAVRPPADAPAATDAPLRISTVEAEAGRLFVQGTGPAGARATIYLNDTAVSDAVVGPDGRWSLTVERGLSPGSYGIRVDQVGSEGKVVARAAVPFDFRPEAPVRTAAAETAQPGNSASPSSADGDAAVPAPQAGAVVPPAGAPVGEPPAPSVPDASATGEGDGSPPAIAEEPASGAEGAHPVIAEIGTVSVRRGDSLWRISRASYGFGMRYTVIYEANNEQIRNPDLIYPGQVFVIPPRT